MATRVWRIVLSVALLVPGFMVGPEPALAADPVEFTHFAPEGWGVPFSDPTQLAVGPDGSVWVVDRSAHLIHKLNAAGTEVLSLGTGTAGSGPGQLNNPYGVAVSPDGQRVYVTEKLSTTTGRISVFTQSGEYVGRIDSAGATSFVVLEGAAVAPDGRLLVVDSGTGRKCVYVFEADGTYVQQIVASPALRSPSDVAVGSDGHIFVLDRGNLSGTDRRVVAYNEDYSYAMTISRIGGGSANPGDWGLQIWGIAVDTSGHIGVADRHSGYNRVTRFNSTTGAFIDQWSVTQPQDIAFDLQGRALTIDQAGKRIERWSPAGVTAQNDAIYPKPPDTPGAFNQPRRVAVDTDGFIYVADTLNNRVQKLDSDGGFISMTTTWGAAPGNALTTPRAITLEPDGDVLVGIVYGGQRRIVRYTSDLEYVDDFGAGQIGVIGGIAVSAAGRVFVSDTQANCVREFGADGFPVTRWPADDSAGTDNGDLSAPAGLVVAPNNTLWVADAGNKRVQQFELDGTWKRSVSADSLGNPLFSQPTAVATAPDGTVWVTDAGWNRVHKLSSTGAPVDQWGGQAAGFGMNQFSSPEGIAAGPTGEIYVADTGANRLKRAIVSLPDTTPPVITVGGVSEGWAKSPVNVSLSALDGDVSSDVYYSLDDSAPSLLVTGTVSITTEGTTTVRYSSRDAAGNEATGSAMVRIDDTGPTISHDAPDEWRPMGVEVNLWAEDAGAGLDYIEYRFGGPEWVTGSVFTVVAEGETAVDVRAVDLLGNVTNRTVLVRIDSSGIVINHSIPATWQIDPVTVNFSTSTGASVYYGVGVEAPVHLFEVDFIVDIEGITSVNYEAVTPEGGRTQTRIAHVLIDRSAPWVWDDAPASVVRGPVNVRIFADDLYSGVSFVEYRLNGIGSWNPGENVVLTTEGTYLVEYRARDNVGFWSETGSAVVVVDNTPPDASDDAPGGWVRGEQVVTLSMVGDEEGTILYSLDGSTPQVPYVQPLVFSAQGVNRLKYRARDIAGNDGPVRESFVRIDDTPPVITHDAAASYEGTATFTLWASDGLSDIDSVSYRVDSGSWVTTSGAVAKIAPVTAVGTRTVQYRATDLAGNEATGAVTLVVEEYRPPDFDPPVTTALGVLEAWSGQDVIVELVATDATSGVAATYYIIENEHGDSTDESLYSEPIVFDQDGTFLLAYWSEDRAGNTEDYRLSTVRVDKTAPTAPGFLKTGSLTSTSVRLEWGTSIERGSGLSHYRISDEGSVDTTVDAGTRTLAVMGLEPGLMTTLTVCAVDRAGNVSPPRSVALAVPPDEASVEITETSAGSVTYALVTERLAGGGAATKASMVFSSVTATGSLTLSRVPRTAVAPPGGYRVFAPGISLAFAGQAGGQMAFRLPYDQRLPSGRARQLEIWTFQDGQWEREESVPSVNGTDRTFTFYPKDFTTYWILEPDTVSTTASIKGVTSPYRVGYRKAAVIRVRLVDAGGVALPGYTLGLQRWTGSTWVDVTTLSPVSGSPGSYRVSRTAYKRTRTKYRVILRDNPLYSAARVGAAVKPHAKLTRPTLSVSIPRSGRAFYVSGKMYPAHKGTVKLRYERYVSGRWSHVKTVALVARSTGAYRSKVRLTSGRWRVRASHKDWGHLLSRSTWRTFTVR